MKPYAERTPDSQYQKLLRYILENGDIKRDTNQGEPAITVFKPPIQLRFDLRNTAPLITERKIGFWKQAVGEILAMINGVTTIKGFQDFGCQYWDKWGSKECCDSIGTPEGDLGPGSYGRIFHDFPTADGGSFNQVAALVQGLKGKPWSRANLMTAWNPWHCSEYGDRKVFCAPCHGNVNCYVHDGYLDMSMDQRSCDVPIGLPSNLIQYAALQIALAQVAALIPRYYIHTFVDAHIYQNQVWAVELMLQREPKQLPRMKILDPTIADIFAFRRDHFAISDYTPHPPIPGIPVSL